MGIFLAWFIFAVLVGLYAGNKGRSGIGFFFLSLILSPLIGFIIAAFSSPIREKHIDLSGLKRCPVCAEYVQGEALICRFCRYEFVPGITFQAPNAIASQVAPDLPRPLDGPTTWGPTLGRSAANIVKWCKQNPGWFIFPVLIVIFFTFRTTGKHTYEQAPERPPGFTAPPSSPSDVGPVPAHLTDDENNRSGAVETGHSADVETAIDLCKAETIKRQPNASTFVPHAYEVSEKQPTIDTLHVQIGWGLAYDAEPAMVSDCRVSRRNNNLTLSKIKLTFAD